jgi:TonB family protein
MHRIIVLFLLTTVSTYALAQSETNDSTFMSPGQQEEVVIEDPTLDPVVELFALEQQPEFPLGTAALYRFLGQNIKYPEIAQHNNIEGNVVLSFIIEKDGSISNIKAIREIGGGCTEEAIRVVKMMPIWKPGMHNGQLVRVRYTLPILFKLSDKKAKKKGG